MKISKFLKMLPFALVACMLLSTVSAFAAPSSSYDSTTKKVTVVVSEVTAGEEVAIMVYDKVEGVTPATVAADKIWYIDQAAAGADGTVTFTFYLKDGAGEAEKQVAIGKATGSAADLTSTFAVASTPSYTVGDLDGEDGVDEWDSVLLLQYLAGGYDLESDYDILVLEAAADIDGEDGIDEWDAVLLLQYLAGGYPDADEYFE